MLKLAVPILLAVGGGVSLIVRQVLNANLRHALNSIAWSSFVSYFIGIIR